MDEFKVDKKGDKIIYKRQLFTEPYNLYKFPEQLDNYTIVIISSTMTPNISTLVEYLLNTYTKNIEFIKDIDNGKPTDYNIYSQFKDQTIPTETKQKQLAIIDLSPEGKFKTAHPLAIKFYNDNNSDTPDWLKSLNVFATTNPRVDVSNNKGDLNISHTIWISDSFENTPKSLLSNAHMTYLLDSKSIKDYMVLKNGAAHFNPGSSVAISSVITENNKIMIGHTQTTA